MLDMNLQLFAEDEEVVDESINSDQVDTEEIDESDVDADEVDELSDDEAEEQVEEEPKRNDTVSLARFMNEKRKRKELERMLSQQEADRKEFNTAQEYLERGYPEFEARNLAKRDVSTARELESLKARYVNTEIKDLARSDDFFSDAETFADDIREKMQKLDVSAEDAYMLLRGKARTREMKTKTEQRNATQRKTKNVASSKSSAPRTAYKLDDNDKKALAGLQKMNPEAGWTAEKFHKLMRS